MSSVVFVLLGMVLVGLGSGIGAVGRWGIKEAGTHLVARRTDVRSAERIVPWMTFGANIVACFVLGVVVARLGSASGPGEYLYLLLSVGICGGLSTLSTAAMDVVDLVRRGTTAAGIGYLLLTAGVGMAMLWLGLVIAT